jgi:hypothetical protein
MSVSNSKTVLGPRAVQGTKAAPGAPKVILGRAARDSVHNNTVHLEKRAAIVAEGITIPSGVEFARFEHAGKTYAISVRLLVEVELLNNRVPDVVLRSKPRGR